MLALLLCSKKIEEIGRAMGIPGDWKSVLDGHEEFLRFLGVPERLSSVGLLESDIPNFVNLVMEKRFLMGNLPRIPTERDVRTILEKNF